MKRYLIASILYATTLSADTITLKDTVKQVLDTNPIILERLHNYRATRADLRGAEAGYYPTIDIEAGVGKDYKGRFSSEVDKNYDVFHNALIIRQNLFDGFSTSEQVNYNTMRTLAAAYSFLEKANDVTLQTIKVYIDVLRYKELLKNAQIHLKHLKKLYSKIKKSYKAGLTKYSEVSRVKSSLYSAKANMLVSKNRLANALYNFKRVTGMMVLPDKLKDIKFNLPLPKDLERATMFALEYNPSLRVTKYNIKGAEALYRESKSKFMPRFDLEVSANYDDEFDSKRGYPDRADSVKAMVMMRYNIYNGGKDEAMRVHRMSKVSQEMEVMNDLRRQVIDGMDLSWSTYKLEKEHIPMLREYRKQSQKTLNLYWKEFNLGERSLLDLLAIEKDLKSANDELTDAKYNLLISKYRIFDAMGLTMASVVGDVKKYYKRVGLFNNGKSQKDILPVSYDKDRDGVPADKDLCPASNSKNVRASGCKKSSDALRVLSGRI